MYILGFFGIRLASLSCQILLQTQHRGFSVKISVVHKINSKRTHFGAAALRFFLLPSPFFADSFSLALAGRSVAGVLTVSSSSWARDVAAVFLVHCTRAALADARAVEAGCALVIVLPLRIVQGALFIAADASFAVTAGRGMGSAGFKKKTKSGTMLKSFPCRMLVRFGCIHHSIKDGVMAQLARAQNKSCDLTECVSSTHANDIFCF
jgi:hypothetical protein